MLPYIIDNIVTDRSTTTWGNRAMPKTKDIQTSFLKKGVYIKRIYLNTKVVN